MRNIFGMLLSVILLNGVFTGSATADGLAIATLEWPPYTSEGLPKGGATTSIVQDVLEKSGYSVEVKTFPWKRAISAAKNEDGIVAYFPGYHCRHVEGFIASDPIGNGPLGFAQHSDAPVSWQALDDIGELKLKVGTVLGYANTDEFDEKAGTGWIRAIPAKDDITNLRKLMRQRIDLAVIDKLVLSYLLATEPTLSDAKDALQFNAKPLEDKALYLCVVDSSVGRDLVEKFNAGLADVDLDQVVEDYFAKEF